MSRSPAAVQATAALTCLRNFQTPVTHESIKNGASTKELYEAARILGDLTVDAGSRHGEAAAVKLLSPDLLPAWAKAATHLNSYLSQQHLQHLKQQQPQLHQQLTELVVAMLYMWTTIANPFTYQRVLKVLPAIHIAAELALHVLTGSEGGGLACDFSIQWHNAAVQFAGAAIQVVGRCVDMSREAADDQAQQGGPGAMGYPRRPEPALVSDAVQKAFILHLCLFVRAWREEQQQQRQEQQGGRSRSSDSKSSSGSWAPAEATKLLQQLGVPLDAAQPYAYAVSAAFDTTLVQQMDLALQCFAGSVKLRTMALSDPGWAQRYRGFIAAAAAAPVGGRNAIEHNVLGPDFHVGQMISLAVEYVAVTGFTPERANPVIVGFQTMSTMLMLTMGQYQFQHPEQIVRPERSVRERYTEQCLEHIWSSLGKQLLRASGVAEAELEGDGSQPAAAVVGGAEDAYAIPADEVIDRMRTMWHKYMDCLFYSIRVYKECFQKLPYELYMRQPMRASRVVEAALRTAQHGHLITGLTSASSSMIMLLDEIHAAVDATSPEGAAATTNLLQNKRLTVRSCCQLVSTLKTLSLPLDPRIDRLAVILQQVQITSSVAVVGPAVHAWAIGKPPSDPDREAAMHAVHPEGQPGASGREAVTLSSQDALSAPCYPAWLAITGRALLTLGRLLDCNQEVPAWLQACLDEATSGECAKIEIAALHQHTSAFAWLHEQLQELQNHPEPAASVQLPPGMLEDLTQAASGLAPKFQALSRLCQSALGASGEKKSRAEVAVFRGFLKGSAERWLHEGLQELGAKVWAAWPQKYACNDDTCLEMRGLDEHSCVSGGRLRCSSCKVAYYCCKQHQARHWPQHKKVCSHLKQMAQEAA